MTARDILFQHVAGLSQEQYQHLSGELGVTRSVLNALMQIVEREGVSPGHRRQELEAAAKAHKSGELLKGQLGRLNVRAVELIREGKLDRAVEEVREGERLLLTLLADAPDDVTLDMHLGYFHKTLGQAFQAAGQDKLAAENFDLAARVFQRVKDNVPATAKTAADIADALNGLGNIYYQRGEFEKALTNYRQAVDLNPAYAYAWHDMFGAYDGLARKGKIDLKGMRLALQKVKETGTGVPGLGADYLAQLEGSLRYWESVAPNKGKRRAAGARPGGRAPFVPIPPAPPRKRGAAGARPEGG